MQKRPTPGPVEARYRVNTIASRLGVHSSTLKRLEGRGIFTPQRDCAGHRRYSEDDFAKLREIFFGAGSGER